MHRKGSAPRAPSIATDEHMSNRKPRHRKATRDTGIHKGVPNVDAPKGTVRKEASKHDETSGVRRQTTSDPTRKYGIEAQKRDAERDDEWYEAVCEQDEFDPSALLTQEKHLDRMSEEGVLDDVCPDGVMRGLFRMWE